MTYRNEKFVSNFSFDDRICPDLEIDVTKTGVHAYVVDGADFEVEVMDSLKDYVEMMKSIFDFPAIKEYLR